MNNFSVLSIEQEINLLLRFGMSLKNSPNESQLFKLLSDIKNIFTSEVFNDSAESYKENIKAYCDEVNNLFSSLNLNADDVFLKLKEKIEDLIKAKKIALDGYQEIFNEYIANNNTDFKEKDKIKFFLIFKSIRDLLIKDITIIGKKEVDSYLENYKKIFYNKDRVVPDLLQVIQNCQTGMLLCYERQFSWMPHYHGTAKTEIEASPGLKNFQKILNNPHAISQEFKADSSWIEKLNHNRILRQLDLFAPSVDQNLLFSTAVHTLHTDGGQTIYAKNIKGQSYAEPVGSTVSKDVKIYFLNELFKDIGISFKDKNDLKSCYLKLKMYSDLTGDKEITDPYKILVTQINRSSIPNITESYKNYIMEKDGSPKNANEQDKKKFIENKQNLIKSELLKFKSSSIFNRINQKSEKLKIIFRLNFDQKTINTLKEFILVQIGNEVKLIKNDNPPFITPNIKDLKDLRDLMQEDAEKTAYYNYYKLIKSLDLEINNLFFKLS